MKILRCLVLFFAIGLTGCSSYVAQVEPGRNPASYQRFFVKSNFHDNNGIDIRIVRALQARGLEAERGPLTMLPRTAQAVVTYDDRWTWDFKNNITYLRIAVQDTRSERIIATATFSGPAALTTSPDEAIERLLVKLLGRVENK